MKQYFFATLKNGDNIGLLSLYELPKLREIIGRHLVFDYSEDHRIVSIWSTKFPELVRSK